jgi:hypothetical protein
MIKFENYILGDTDETLSVDTSEQLALGTQTMVQQAKRTLVIISRDLDPVIYNTAEFCESVRQMVLKSRYTKVRILVHEPMQIVKRGHRLVDLAMHLTSFIEIRVPDQEHADFNESVMIADAIGYAHRINGERYEARLNFNDGRTSRILLKQFEGMWGKAKTDQNFKRALL